MSASVNDTLRDASVRRKVGLGLYANGLVRKVMGVLNRADAELFAKLVEAIEASVDGASFKVKRLESQLESVRKLNGALYERLRLGLETDLQELSLDELGFQGDLLSRPLGVRLPFTALAPAQVYAAAMARPFQGRLLREWAKSVGEVRMLRLRDAVRMGVIQGETTSQIVRRVRGTKALGYRDGIIEADRRSIEAVVRTAVGHVASVARDQTFKANADIIKAVQWVSTLDTRTSNTCRVRDGLRFTSDTHRPIGHSMPWLGGPGQAHWNCRSTATPVLKSFAELGLNLPDMPAGVRASMSGTVPADTTYGEWFARQSAARQDIIVGPARGGLFRSGKVTFTEFTNDKGRLLTLNELARFSRD